LANLLEKGAISALFLAITPPPAGSPVPHFLGTAAAFAPTGAATSKTKLELWSGLKWDPTVVPELWNYFVRAGFVELSPPGTMTNVASTRNVVRAAFGCAPDEWLTLVSAGTPNACRGVLAILSKASLQHVLAGAMVLIGQNAPAGSKAA
jgi:hypothetical protein